MLKQHLKITVRVFLKNKLFTIINISGLAIGIAAYILITQYVAFESNYDRHMTRVDDLYRVTLTTNLGDKGFVTSATNHPAVATAMKQDIPEIESYARLVEKTVMWGTFVMTHKNEQGDVVKFNANDYSMYIADSATLDLFNIKLLSGNVETALAEPGSIILSSRIAKQIFGNSEPLNKEFSVDSRRSLKVTGVFEELAQATHIQYDMLVSFSSLQQWKQNSWIWPEFYNYVRLKPGTDPHAVEAKFPDFVQKYLGNIMKDNEFEARMGLQPVKDIHLKSHLLNEASTNASEQTLNFLLMIAIFVILIALMNFINLSTAKSIERAKEVGLKKVVGIRQRDLIMQFLFESLAINLIAIFIAMSLVTLLMGPFNQLVGLEVMSMSMWLESPPWLILITIFLLGGLLAGIYPAFVLSNFKPIEVIKGKFHQSGSGAMVRKGLVMAQFAISIALIAGTFIVYSQFSFMQEQDLGYDADQSLIVNAPRAVDSTFVSTMRVFKTELLRDPNVNSVTMTTEIPGKKIVQLSLVRKLHERNEEGVTLGMINIDEDFLPTYNIGLVSGRNFKREDRSFYGYNTGRNTEEIYRVMLNETAAKALGFAIPEESIGQKIVFKYGTMDRTAQVLGVMEDYHQQSLKNGYEPLIFMNPLYYNAIYMTINMNTSNARETLESIGEKYDKFFPRDPYKYFFLNDFFNKQYNADLKFSKICLVFAGLAIFIATLGLFGLGSYIALQKTKEISVRKVLGAGILQALILIPKNLLGLVLVSGLVALPLTYFMAKEWLSEYAFRIDISVWMFVIPLLTVLVVATLSVLPQSIKVALVNPVDTLRNE